MANLSAFGGAQPITPGGLVELVYGEADTAATITATSSASMDNLTPEVTVVCDGSPVIVEFYAPIARATQDAAGTGDQLNFVLQYDGSVQEDSWGRVANRSTAIGHLAPVSLQHRMTPTSGSHTFRVGAYVSNASRNGYVGAGSPYPPMFIRVSKIVQQNDGLKPFWTPPITASLPSNPDTGDQIIYKHGGTGNIGSHLPMIYDGTKWQPAGEAVLCRWNCGSASQVFSVAAATNVTVGDYNTVTFTPPWDGYYEISQKTGMWELNSGIGMYTSFSATDGSAHHTLHYIQDWNGPYQHHREGHGMPIAVYLYSAKTYRFTAAITYAAGNTGTINFIGTAHVRALSR